MVTTPDLDLSGDARRLVMQANGEARIDLADLGGAGDAGEILKASFRQFGDDLVIDMANGRDIVVKDYFAQDAAADLVLDGAARLDGSLVSRLAQPAGGNLFAESGQMTSDALQLAQAGDAVGSVESITGTVSVQRGGATIGLAQGDPIFLNDVIQAGVDGSVGIVFVDGTTFSLSAGARMTIDEMVYDPSSGGGNLVTSVLQGAFVFSTGSIAPNGNMEVNTPVGTIGIRGTTVAARIALEGSDTVIVLLADPDGHVGRIYFQNGGGMVELTEANTAVFVSSFFIGPGTPTEVTPAQLIEFFDQLLQFHTTGPAQQEGALEEGAVDDLASQLADQLGLGEFALAAGGEEMQIETTDSVGKLSEWLGFVPDPLQPVTFTTVNLSGNVTTGPGGLPGGPNQHGISKDYLDPFNQQTGTTPTSLFNYFTGGPGNDLLDASKSSKSAIITGSGGDDTLIGSAFDDQVSGGGGNDTIIAGHGGGNDFYDGGADIDTIVYASTDEGVIVDLTTGKASGDPDIGIDKLVNIENVTGGSGNDKLIGDGANNVLNGAAGADELQGNGGSDTLIGGQSGKWSGAVGNSTWLEDTDVAVFTGNAADYKIVVGEGGDVQVFDLRDGSPDGVDTLLEMEKIRFADQEIWISDLNYGDNYAPTDIQIDGGVVPENAPGAAIGYLYAVDADDEDWHQFSIADERFEIVEGELRLREGVSLDFEALQNGQIEIEVTVTDSAGLSFTKTLTVTVSDENDPPTVPVDVDNGGNLVSENAAAGTYVGITAQATDQDPDETVTYSLADDAGGRFQIDAQTGKVTVAEGADLDFEQATSYQIVVRANSSGELGSEETFTINIGDVNEAPGEIVDIDQDNPYYNSVFENASNGTKVGITAQASDPDAGDVITYTLADDFDGLFQIDGVTGIVTIADNTKLDFETTSSYQLTVIATDKGGLTSQQAFTVQVLDADEGNQVIRDGNRLIVGKNAFGELAIDGDGIEDTSETIIGEESGGEGIIRVTGHMARLGAAPQGITVGDAGKGHLIVEAGGTAYADGAEGGENNLLIIGKQSGSQGRVDVTGFYTEMVDNQQWFHPSDIMLTGNNNTVIVGLDGKGELNIGEGAFVSALNMEVAFGTGTGSVTVDGEGALLHLSTDNGKNTSVELKDAGGFLRIGHRDGSEGELNVLNGGLVRLTVGETDGNATPGITIADEFGSKGALLVEGPQSRLEVIGNPSIKSDPGNNDYFLQGPWITVGEQGEGTAIVTKGGTILLSGNEVYLGVGGGDFDNPNAEEPALPVSTLTISDGGYVKVEETLTGADVTSQAGVYVGDMASGNGKVLVTGAGSALEVFGTGTAIVVGNDGRGILNVEDGGTVGGNLLIVGDTGTGTVTVDGTGTTIRLNSDYGLFMDGSEKYASAAVIGFGDGGVGTLNITNGGHVRIEQGSEENLHTIEPWLDIARKHGSTGTVIVDGTNSIISVGNQDSVGSGIAVGRNGDGTLTIRNGAMVEVTGDYASVTVGAGWDITKGGQMADGTLLIESGGKLTITESGDNDSRSGGFIVGNGDHAEGSATVTGAGSQLNVLGMDSFIAVAHDAGSKGEMVVAAGAEVYGLDLRVGRGGEGSMTIMGVGTKVTLSSDFGRYSGSEGVNRESGFVRVGQESGSVGMLSVLAGATLLISNDAEGETGAPGMAIGVGTGSNGSVTIAGSQSSISIIETPGSSETWGAYLEIGGAGYGSMVVKDGGSFELFGEDAQVVIGSQVGGSGSLLVSGAGSAFNVAGDYARIEIGQFFESSNSAGSISVVNGATLSVTSDAVESYYHIFVNDGSLLEISNATVNGGIMVAGGSLFAGYGGTATVNGDVLMDDGNFSPSRLGIGIIGPGSNHGSFDINGAFHLNYGIIEFKFDNGYNPAAESSFTFLTASQVYFGNLNNPSDISLAAYGVSQFFDFRINATGTSIAFEALTNSLGGNSTVFKGGNQNDFFGGDESKGYAYLSGGGGDDWLLSNYGAAGEGRHILYGGAGNDVMQGFGDADEFYVGSVGDNYQVYLNGAERAETFDRIIQFDTAADRIVFDHFYANEGGWGFDLDDPTGFDPNSFIQLDQGETYNGVLSFAHEAYDGKNPVLILEDLGSGKYNLIYDGNGAEDGYTIVANVQTTSGNFSVENVGINLASM
jgi:T5SS/PEP-CTERM-associated repeat protein